MALRRAGHDVDGDQHRRAQQYAPVELQLTVAQRGAPVALEDEVVQRKVHAEQRHEDADHHVHRRRVPVGDGVAVGAEAAGARRAEHVHQRIVQVEAAAQKGDHHQNRQPAVDGVEYLGVVGHPGHQLVRGGTRGLRPHQVDRARAHLGDQRQRQHQHAHAAGPVGKAAPEQKALGQRLHVPDDGRAGGGEAGHRLKEAVHQRGDVAAEVEGQPPEEGHQYPAERHHREALPGAQEVPPGPDQRQREARREGDGHGDQYRHGVRAAVDQRYDQRQRHQRPRHAHHVADQMKCQSLVHFFKPSMSNASSRFTTVPARAVRITVSPASM